MVVAVGSRTFLPDIAKVGRKVRPEKSHRTGSPLERSSVTRKETSTRFPRSVQIPVLPLNARKTSRIVDEELRSTSSSATERLSEIVPSQSLTVLVGSREPPVSLRPSTA